MNFTDIVGDIVEILVSGISGLAQGIGSGINTAVTELFITTTGEGASATHSLSVAGGIIVTFGAIALAVSLTTFVTKWLFSLGARD